MTAPDRAVDVSVLVPAKDEAENLPEFLRQCAASLGGAPFSFEVVVVDDGSRDDTAAVLETAASKWNFVPFRPGLVGGHCLGVAARSFAARARELGVEPRVTLAGREVNEGLASRDWGVPRLWIQAGLHDTDIVMARFDFAYDPNAARALAALGIDEPTLEIIDANEADIEAAGVDLHSYTAPGDGHRVLERAGFYDLEVDGIPLVEWIAALLDGRPLADVRCDDCAAAP